MDRRFQIRFLRLSADWYCALSVALGWTVVGGERRWMMVLVVPQGFQEPWSLDASE